ncbi:hypothetical protein AMATHDRAFT_225 [Amanita thiersii Skay4041]|uniref:Uncharacterized protein n=1 Tax=Amanita thiersii Skay4041 TaxID=703135 RepID=A0A2A9P1T1_9AGAR|nr:hypothetical protein AMATHDRAFT_225 [Amanita thiersii Skay4041]
MIAEDACFSSDPAPSPYCIQSLHDSHTFLSELNARLAHPPPQYNKDPFPPPKLLNKPNHAEPHLMDSDVVPTAARHPSRVRFRSRVRIASGFSRRHRESSSNSENSEDGSTPFSSGASMSSSPASSIYAPLRSPSDAQNDESRWAPLGQRVHLLSLHRKGRRKFRGRKRKINPSAPQFTGSVMRNGINVIVNERTPLTKYSLPSTIAREVLLDNYGTYTNQDEEARLSREIDYMFGTWPGRLLNRYVCIRP